MFVSVVRDSPGDSLGVAGFEGGGYWGYGGNVVVVHLGGFN